MKKIALTISAFIISLCAGRLSAQGSESLDANNIKSTYIPGASLFTPDSINYNGYEAPRGSGIKSIFVSNFWLSGLDPANNLKIAAMHYSLHQGMTYGPIATNYSAHYDSLYNRVFKVTKAEIAYHIAHHSDPGYIAAPHIAQWPGNGDTANGEAAILAPFADLNGNGKYEPVLGDFPDICGDEAVFMMMNDDRPGVNSCAMHIELHALAYVSAGGSNSPLSNTTIVSVSVFNRSGGTYSDMYFSNFVDNDLGCANNDRVGCDTTGNYFFVYNGHVNGVNGDAGSVCPAPEIGYGLRKVTQATVFLNRRMSSFTYFTNGALAGMRDPSTCAEYRNYQTGHWDDGSPFTYGGYGYNGSIATSYVFPGDPADTAQWSEVNTHSGPIPPGDRRAMASVVIGSLAPGQSATVDIAYLTSYADSTAADFAELAQLRLDAQALQQLYARNQVCNATPLTTAISSVALNESGLAIYPNPAADHVRIHYSMPDAPRQAQIRISDMLGQILQVIPVSDQSGAAELDLSKYAPGHYSVSLENNAHKVSTRRLVKE